MYKYVGTVDKTSNMIMSILPSFKKYNGNIAYLNTLVSNNESTLEIEIYFKVNYDYLTRTYEEHVPEITPNQMLNKMVNYDTETPSASIVCNEIANRNFVGKFDDIMYTTKFGKSECSSYVLHGCSFTINNRTRRLDFDMVKIKGNLTHKTKLTNVYLHRMYPHVEAIDETNAITLLQFEFAKKYGIGIIGRNALDLDEIHKRIVVTDGAIEKGFQVSVQIYKAKDNASKRVKI